VGQRGHSKAGGYSFALTWILYPCSDYNLNNVRHDASRHFRNKKAQKPETNSKMKNIRDLSMTSRRFTNLELT
jgi:hypothetical protein